MNHLLYRVRRTLLRTLVPEIVWPEFVVLDGARIRVRHAPYSFGVKRVLKRGEYEEEERALLAGVLRPGDVVIEMGGSIGIMTAIIAEKVGSSGFVVSLEGSAALTSYSKTWLEAGGNVEVVVGFGFPVWTLRRRVAVQSFEEKWGSMSGRLTFTTEGGPAVAQSAEPLYDLEALARRTPGPPTVLVADIEGTERIIAEQPPEFPESLRSVLIELHPEMYGDDVKRSIVATIEGEGFTTLAREGNVFLFERRGR